MSDSALPHHFSSALFCKVYCEEVLVPWVVNKGSGKRRFAGANILGNSEVAQGSEPDCVLFFMTEHP